jgi:CRP-like cAMP-binding protein
MKEIILKNIAKHILLSEKEQDHFCNVLHPFSLKRKEYLLHEGDIAKNAAFVTSGCLRAYSIDSNGFEHILQFAPTDWWITDMFSYVSQNPAYLNIDAVEDSEMFLLSRTDQLQLFNDIPSFERYFRILTEKSLVSSRKRTMDNLSMTARERYESFCTYYPTLINTLPQKMIASYIGVTPEFLSKMKASLLKK